MKKHSRFLDSFLSAIERLCFFEPGFKNFPAGNRLFSVFSNLFSEICFFRAAAVAVRV